MLVATHDLELVRSIAQGAIFMVGGDVVDAPRPPANPGHEPVVLALVAALRDVERQRGRGTVPCPSDRRTAA